jgi:hypothetical protein
MQFLSQTTFIVNYAIFIIVFWLGLYIVIHNPRYPISWLTTLTLWSTAALFLHFLVETEGLTGSEQLTGSPWFQGLAVAPALAFWHHTTMLLRPKRLNPWRMIRILGAYMVAVLAIIAQAYHLIWVTPPDCPPLLNCRTAGPLYPYFIAGYVVFFLASMINLIRSARATPAVLLRKQLLTLAYATLVAGLTVPAMMIGTLVNLPVPMLVNSLLLALTIGVIGYGVARFSALMEGRTIHKDFFYNLVMVALITAIYIPICGLLAKGSKTPSLILILIPVLAVLTHALVNPAYRLVDRLVLRRETFQMRTDLQRLARLAFEADAFFINLQKALEMVCRSIHAMYGVVLINESNSMQIIASFQFQGGSIQPGEESFQRDDITHLDPGNLPVPFQEAALLIPLYQESTQFGALVLGRPENGLRFAGEDIDQIINPVDLIGEAVLYNRLRTNQIKRAAEFARVRSPVREGLIPVEIMENALRSLYDFAVLADSPLAGLSLVQSRLVHRPVTHLERGKAVYDLTLEAIQKLAPGSGSPHDPPAREWYPYLILKAAYIDGIPNRDIMMKLYISEGTFNRTRRSAIRSVARALGEMEMDLQTV